MIAPDSSVVIAALAPWHEAHRRARSALVEDAEVRLPAHVAFETTSALSRMPEGRRLAPVVVLDALERGFPQPWLSMGGEGLHEALRRAVEAGVRGGALYDALIAATVAERNGEIVSADRRALPTYRVMNVGVRFIEA